MTSRPGRRALFAAALLATAALAAAAPATPSTPPATTAAAPATPSAPRVPAGEEVAVVSTPHGQIVWRFFPDAAPEHVAYVRKLIAAGFYDGTTFHRVIPHFVVQGGDPNSKNADRADDGEGEGDIRLKAEFSATLHYRPGTVGMARDTDPNSGSCQFFIALENLPRLDGKYTIFGEVIEGLEVARKIAGVPRDVNDNPLEPVAVKVALARRSVPQAALSREAGDRSGELLSGPDKPKPLDPADPRWSPPEPKGELAAAGPDWVRLDLALDAEGRVIDVRFADEIARDDDPRAIAAKARAWSFEPALYEDLPAAVRIGIDATGRNLGAPPVPR
jgi:peptidyl-prolyl cis-trans isomerase B (cyclophilin B)